MSNKMGERAPLCNPWILGGNARNSARFESSAGHKKAAGWRTPQGSNKIGYMYLERYYGFQGTLVRLLSSLLGTERRGRRISVVFRCPLILSREVRPFVAPIWSVANDRFLLAREIKLKTVPAVAPTFWVNCNREARWRCKLAIRRHRGWLNE